MEQVSALSHGLTLAPAARARVQVVWVEPVGSVHFGQQLPDVHHLQLAQDTGFISEEKPHFQSVFDVKKLRRH